MTYKMRANKILLSNAQGRNNIHRCTIQFDQSISRTLAKPKESFFAKAPIIIRILQ